MKYIDKEFKTDKRIESIDIISTWLVVGKLSEGKYSCQLIKENDTVIEGAKPLTFMDYQIERHLKGE